MVRESIGVAVEPGDVVELNAWSKEAQTIRAVVRIRPASGAKTFSLPIELAVPVSGTKATRAVEITAQGVIDQAQVENPSGNGTGTGYTISGAAAQRGILYAQLVLKGAGPLAQGYVYTGHNLSLGEIVEPGPSGGMGFVQNQLIGDPAAGSEYADIVCPAWAVWRVHSIRQELTTSAVVGNRQPQLRLVDAANHVQTRGTSGTQAASLTKDHIWVRMGEIEETKAGSTFRNVLPWTQDLIAGWRIQFITPLLDVGDDYSVNGGICLEEWVMPT